MRIRGLEKDVRHIIDCEVVMEICREESGGSSFSSLRVVSWNGRTAKIEKRAFYKSKDGFEKTGKALGLNANDLCTLCDAKEVILKTMLEHKPKFKTVTAPRVKKNAKEKLPELQS